MSETIAGRLDIQTSSPDHAVCISVDGDSGNVTIGGANARRGSLALRDLTQERIRIGEIAQLQQVGATTLLKYWGLRIRNAQSENEIELGRDEVGGGLTLRDGTGHELLHIGIEPGGLGGPVAYVRMKSGVTRAEALSLDGTGSIEVGGGSVGGRITVKQGDGREAIRINARERLIALGGGNACETWQEWIRIDGNVPSIRLRYVNPIGIEQPPMTPVDHIHLDGREANVWVGGNGVDGDIVLFPKEGDNATLAQASIHLDGNKGDIFLQNADCAEEFDVADGDAPEPGAVMIIDAQGRLSSSCQAYDNRVAGVVSGALELRPGITLASKPGASNRIPLALAGRVYCKVDAQYGQIRIGDLLTTSPSVGHAMKAVDRMKSFGAVIGKALASLESGTGLVPILVALQ